MYAGTLTPDRLQVNSDGKRLNEDGSIAIVETPETKKMAETGLAKGLTGGGSSSGGGGGSSSGGGGGYSRRSSSFGSSSSGSSTKEVEASTYRDGNPYGDQRFVFVDTVEKTWQFA